MILHYALASIVSIAVCVCWATAAPQMPADPDSVIARVGERVAAYYLLARNVICLNESTVQPISQNLSAAGIARTVESELRVESTGTNGDQPGPATVLRDIKRINGRPPRERDRTDRSACTDPNPLSPEPLAFLTPAHRGDYRFTSVHAGKEKDRAALIVDFLTVNRSSAPVLIEDPNGHDDCFDWSGPIAGRGRLWVDAITFDVLRVDRHIDGPVDIRVPYRLQTNYGLPSWVILDRDDQTMRFTRVTFSDPEEVLLLPESIEWLTLVRNGLQSARRTDTFTKYRRFLGTGRIVKTP